MTKVNQNVIDKSDVAEDCYIAQVAAYAPSEYRLISLTMEQNSIKEVLDVGTGEGSFISGIAFTCPNVVFHAIDADEKLINLARKKYNINNLRFESILFDSSFPNKKYDLIHARFAVEHMSDVCGFIETTYDRLNKNGILFITEYYIDDLNSNSEVWRLFRQSELDFYKKFGSHSRISTELPKYMKESGYADIKSIFQHISPSTVGRREFYHLVKTYAILYNKLDNTLFTEKTRDTVVAYCERAYEDNNIEDGLLISHTIGIRK